MPTLSQPPLLKPGIEIIRLTPAISEASLRHALGIKSEVEIKPRLARHLSEVLEKVEALAHPRIILKLSEPEEIRDAFPPSRKLHRYLASLEKVALVAGSIGPEWGTIEATEQDTMKAYLYSAASTALARATLIQARRELAHRFQGMEIADSLSPGIAGLVFSMQQQFADLLPLSEIGVSYDAESYFLTPLASVTAFIGIGTAVDNPEALELCGEILPNCPRCQLPNCSLRVSPYQSSQSSTH